MRGAEIRRVREEFPRERRHGCLALTKLRQSSGEVDRVRARLGDLRGAAEGQTEVGDLPVDGPAGPGALLHSAILAPAELRHVAHRCAEHELGPRQGRELRGQAELASIALENEDLVTEHVVLGSIADDPQVDSLEVRDRPRRRGELVRDPRGEGRRAHVDDRQRGEPIRLLGGLALVEPAQRALAGEVAPSPGQRQRRARPRLTLGLLELAALRPLPDGRTVRGDQRAGGQGEDQKEGTAEPQP